MRYQYLAIVLAVAGSVLTPSIALAKSARSAFEQDRSTALKWEIGYLALSAIDAAETIHCLNRGTCREANPIFGKRPSATKLILAKSALGLIHFAAFRHLNKDNPRAALRYAQISAGVQGGVVLLNARIAFK